MSNKINTENKDRKPIPTGFVAVQGRETEVGRNSGGWRNLIASFISSQDVSESSRKLYTRTLSLFFAWTDRESKNLSELTRKDILEYKDYLQERGLSSLSIGSYVTVVRKFYFWTEGERLYPDIAKGIKTPRRKQAYRKQHLTDEKSRELLSYFQSQSLRDYAIANLILRTGLRTIEVVRANVEDITFKGQRRILRVWGKGRIERDDFVVLSEKAYLPIRNYLATARKGAKPGEPLFTSSSRQNHGERLTTKTISTICKDGLKAIGLDGKEFTAHSLRHTTAVAILKHGGQLTDVQSVLRHSSPVTSQIYTESVKEELRLQNAPELIIDDAF